MFRDVCGAPETDWRFTAHQFRRFFATLYFWWYDNSTDIAALSHHLRHFEIEMTQRYVRSVGYGAQWRDAHEEWKAGFFQDAADGSRRVSGKAGRRLIRLVEKLEKRFRKDIDVVPRDQVVNQILRIGKRLGAPFKLHVWGTICACPPASRVLTARQMQGFGRYRPRLRKRLRKCVWGLSFCNTHGALSAARSSGAPKKTRSQCRLPRFVTQDDGGCGVRQPRGHNRQRRGGAACRLGRYRRVV